jgi:glycosyltransferase involved in cell wall biosynthesis
MKPFRVDHTLFPKIELRPKDEKRPLWSVMIPCWKNLEYIDGTLKSVLQQDLGPDDMQIMICLDGNDQEEILKHLKQFPENRIEFYAHPKHVGHTRNFNTCLRFARGHLVHLLHADDRVRPGFYRKLTRTFEENPQVDAIFTRFIYIEPDDHWQALSGIEMRKTGVFTKFMDQIAVRNFLISSAFVVKRKVYETVGGFCEQIRSYEDWEMWKRIGMASTVWYEPEPLTLYRKHANSYGNFNRNKLFIIEGIEKGIEISKNYFPEHRSKEWTAEAKRIASRLAVKLGRHYLKNKQLKLSAKYMGKALKLNNGMERFTFLYRYTKDFIRYVPRYPFM